jgi:hypothetical protein
MKYSKAAHVVRWSGGTTPLSQGMSADDDHPLVLERPDLFGDEPPGAELRKPKTYEVPAEAPVERATRAPGEKRNVKRGSTDSE